MSTVARFLYSLSPPTSDSLLRQKDFHPDDWCHQYKWQKAGQFQMHCNDKKKLALNKNAKTHAGESPASSSKWMRGSDTG